MVAVKEEENKHTFIKHIIHFGVHDVSKTLSPKNTKKENLSNFPCSRLQPSNSLIPGILAWEQISVIAAIINFLSFQSHSFVAHATMKLALQTNLNCAQIYGVNKNVCFSTVIVCVCASRLFVLHQDQLNSR